MTGPIDALPPDAPATVEDVRASRRWTWVAIAWAVAASAIAVIALIQANKDDNTQTQTQTTGAVTAQQFSDFQKQTNERLDAFSRRLNDTASSADLDKIDKRLTKVEDDLSQVKDDSGKQGDSITQMQSDIKDLQQRVDDLESQQQGSGQQGTTTTP